MLQAPRFACHRVITSLALPLIILMVSTTLTACDDRLAGTYEESSGWGRLEFRGDTVYVTMGVADTTFAAEYELDGDKIIIKGPGASQVYTIARDGSIEGGLGMRYVKKQAG